MNREEKKLPSDRRIDGRIKDFAVVIALAIALGFSVWKVFYQTEDTALGVSGMSATEQKISRMLSQMEGVGDAEVMVHETEEGVKGAIVVCSGAKDFQVLISVREAVATALGTEQKDVKIYLKK